MCAPIDRVTSDLTYFSGRLTYFSGRRAKNAKSNFWASMVTQIVTAAHRDL